MEVSQALVQSNLICLFWLKRKKFCILGSALYMHVHTHICSGLQAAEGVHHCPGTNEVHLSRLLEDGLRERVWCDCDAVRPGGEWRGWEELSFIQVAHILLQPLSFYRSCATITGLLMTPRGCRSTESSLCLFSKPQNRIALYNVISASPTPR